MPHYERKIRTRKRANNRDCSHYPHHYPLSFRIIVLVWYGWHKFLFLKKRIRKETREASSAVSDPFNLLKENVRETIKILEKTHTKRELTKEEDKILKQFKRDAEDAEKFIKKEVDDIGKLLK